MGDRTSASPSQSKAGLQGNIVDYLLEHRLSPDEARRPYLLMPHGVHTYGDLQVRICQAGNFLRSLGVQPGDRVLFSLCDGLEFPALFLGAMKIGAVALPLNTFLQPKDYAYYIADSAAKVVVVDTSLVERIDAIRHTPGFPGLLFVASGQAPGYRSWQEEVDAQPRELATWPCRPDDVAFWLYSSGSTGDPKGVPHTHEHVYWSCELFGLGDGGMGLRRDDEILCPPKMFFAYGLGNQVYFPIRAGAKVIVEPAPVRPAPLLQRLVATRPTVMMAVPTLYAGLLDLMRQMSREQVREACSRLRMCVSGGELLPVALYRQWQEMTGTEILDGVGTTELTHMFLFNQPGAARPGSCGRIVPGYTAKLLNDQREEVPEGEIGNLFVQGPTAATLYWNKPEKTAATMWDSGVLTGDKCLRDAEGYYFHVGRVDDMLRVGGVWVSPGEVEAALAEHVAVLECAVIGAPDEHDMIKPYAYVVPKQGVEPTPQLAQDMLEHLRARLAHIKCPRSVELVAELPKTATGKIQRFRLRAMRAAS